MAEVRPLAGVRYNPRLQANVGTLIAPPYDTLEPGSFVGDTFRASYNIAELENVNLGTATDSHALAAARYHDWRAKELLIRDDAPGFYVHDHTYRDHDLTRHRRGLLARVRLVDWSERIVLPHERTFPGPREERLARLRAVRANLSPLYLLYRDEAGASRDLLVAALNSAPLVATGTDAAGGEHRLTRITDAGILDRLVEQFASKQLFVADGHHRYEAALAYRDERRRAGSSPNAPSEFVLAMLADITDPGVQVCPTHRVVNGMPALDLAWLREQLSAFVRVEPDSVGGDPPAEMICELALPGVTDAWRLYPLPGRSHERVLAAERSEDWRSLDVAIGDGLILHAILGIDASRLLDHVTFTHDAALARACVDSGEAQLAILYGPPSLPALAKVAGGGETLPPKSTYFDPKPPAGLVINDLRED